MAQRWQQTSRFGGAKHMSKEKGQQALRLKPIRPELAEYIRLANLLPRPEDLPGADVTGRIPLLEGWDPHLLVLLHEYPSFREFLNGALRDGLEPFQICDKLKKIRMVLYTIARHEAARPLCPANQPGPHLEGLISTRTDAKGILRVVHDPLLQALEGVEAKRIRECKRCGKIYWAGRVDMPGCSKECTHALRQKRYRENYLLKYKHRRIDRLDEQDLQKKPHTGVKNK
jgi:hypothetical protein